MKIEITAEYLASQGLSEDFPQRFWAKVQKTEKCWLWIGSATVAGYGDIGKIRKRPRIYAHRASWILHFGPIPDGLNVCHRCDNPPCICPEHLFLGTDKDNIQDASRKGRLGKGEERPNSKLTEEQVLKARELYAAGGIFQRELGIRFGVSQSVIGDAILRNTWRHI